MPNAPVRLNATGMVIMLGVSVTTATPPATNCQVLPVEWRRPLLALEVKFSPGAASEPEAMPTPEANGMRAIVVVWPSLQITDAKPRAKSSCSSSTRDAVMGIWAARSLTQRYSRANPPPPL